MMCVQFKGPPKAFKFNKAALRLLEVPLGQREAIYDLQTPL
jgi:hypothetical protein